MLCSPPVVKCNQACDWLHIFSELKNTFSHVLRQVRATLRSPAEETARSKHPKSQVTFKYSHSLQILSFGLENIKQSGKFYAVKMAPVDWGSGVCASAYESYMKLSVSKGGTPMLLWTQLFCWVKHANLQVKTGERSEKGVRQSQGARSTLIKP